MWNCEEISASPITLLTQRDPVLWATERNIVLQPVWYSLVSPSTFVLWFSFSYYYKKAWQLWQWYAGPADMHVIEQSTPL